MKKRKGSKKKGRAGAKAPPTGADRLPPSEPASHADDEALFQADHHLETCRSKWHDGQWQDLAALDDSAIRQSPERGKLAALAAAAHSHGNDIVQARRFAKLAIKWGCPRDIVARVLISSVYNSLARCAASLKEEGIAEAHFQDAIRLVEPGADARLLGRTRQIRETARMGLLPDALNAVETNLHSVEKAPNDARSQLSILKTEIDLLKHELMISLKRGQIYGPGARMTGQSSRPGAGLEAKAVSQLGQELWVLERLDYKRDGFFVEFGATDGITLSNSWVLESEFGWNGICAEPNPKFFKDLRCNRSCVVSDACIGPRSGDRVDFILADVYGGIADYADADNHAQKRAAYRARGEILELTTISLEDFLLKHDAPREIDYLSIDTEGSEYDILAAFPFDRWTIRLITVEHNFTPMRDDIHTLLASHGYERTEAQWDDWYALTR